MVEANETHKKIIEILEQKGPSLPIQIAKQIRLSSLFVSAFLSELADEKRIKISHMKVGGSPLYFLSGQEQLLEKFHKFLHPKESEAFILLKQKKILKDSEQTPAIRVALRSIKDFAVGFKKRDEIFWRYMLVLESEILQILKKTKKQKIVQKPIAQITKPAQIIPTKQVSKIPKLVKIPEPKKFSIKKPKKQKQKSDFVLKIIQTLSNNHHIIKEKDYKPKEYNCIIQINSNLGPITVLTQAKDKKTISEADLRKLLSNAQSKSFLALILYTGKLSKKAQKYAEEYSSILKTKRI